MKIIGDKSNFALEYEIKDRDNLTGHSRIWFGNQYIGSKVELVYLKSYILDNLKRIGNIGKLYFDLGDLTISQQYKQLETKLNNIEDNLIHNYLVSFGTLSDDYTIFAYLDNNNNLCITWKLDAVPYFPDIDYKDKKIHYFKMPIKEYLNQYSNFENTILKG